MAPGEACVGKARRDRGSFVVYHRAPDWQVGKMFRSSGYFFIALIGLILVGFSKTYFMKLDESFPPVIHLHVLFLGAWVLLIAGQAFLIRHNQGPTHRQLGELSYVLAPIIVISGLYLSRIQFESRLGTAELASNLRALWLPVSHFTLFGFFFVLAVVYRKKRLLHARYMIIATLLFVPPALSRALGIFKLGLPSLSSLDLSFIATDIVLLALLTMDLRKRRNPAPFALGLAAFVFIQFGLKYAGDNPAWRHTAKLLVDF